MQLTEVFQAQERMKTTTGAARATRRLGMVPAIIYGGKEEPKMVAINCKQLLQESQKAGFFNRVYEVAVGKNKCQVIVRDLQLHPRDDIPLHVDFQRITKDSKINVSVPLVFINEDKSPGLKMGGILNIVLHSIEVVCSPHAIPEKLEINLTGLAINHSIHLDALKLPDGVKIAHPERDSTLATIATPSGMKEEAAAATPA